MTLKDTIARLFGMSTPADAASNGGSAEAVAATPAEEALPTEGTAPEGEPDAGSDATASSDAATGGADAPTAGSGA